MPITYGMRTIGSAAELERTRKKAVDAVVRKKMRQTDVARAFGLHPDTVGRWVRAFQNKKPGTNPLRAVPSMGRPRTLDNEQYATLRRELLKGALRHGFEDDLWSIKRVRTLIHRLFGVRFSHSHARVLLTGHLGWTSQVPETRAAGRNEREIRRFVNSVLPRLKKSPPA
jgi:transposase